MTTAEAISVEGPWALGDSGLLFVQVMEMFHQAQRDGEFMQRRRLPEDDDYCVWVGNIANVQAFATFHEVGLGRVWLDLIYVRPYARRAGLGRQLIEAVERWTVGQGCDLLLLGTQPDNARMQVLAEAAGFRVQAIQLGKALP